MNADSRPAIGAARESTQGPLFLVHGALVAVCAPADHDVEFGIRRLLVAVHAIAIRLLRFGLAARFFEAPAAVVARLGVDVFQIRLARRDQFLHLGHELVDDRQGFLRHFGGHVELDDLQFGQRRPKRIVRKPLDDFVIRRQQPRQPLLLLLGVLAGKRVGLQLLREIALLRRRVHFRNEHAVSRTAQPGAPAGKCDGEGCGGQPRREVHDTAPIMAYRRPETRRAPGDARSQEPAKEPAANQ